MNKLFLLLLVTGSLAACQKDQPAPALSQVFELPLAQTATLATGSSPLRVTLTNGQDSRCPSDAQCIWAGCAAVTLELKDAAATAQTARLSLLNKPSPDYTLDSVAVTLNQQAYWLRLLDVVPHLTTKGGSSQPLTAVLRLRPR